MNLEELYDELEMLKRKNHELQNDNSILKSENEDLRKELSCIRNDQMNNARNILIGSKTFVSK